MDEEDYWTKQKDIAYPHWQRKPKKEIVEEDDQRRRRIETVARLIDEKSWIIYRSKRIPTWLPNGCHSDG